MGRALLDAWNDRDGDAILSHLAEDVVYRDVALGERFDDPDAVRLFAEAMVESFSTDYRFTLGQMVSAGDAYAFEWTMSGTNDRADPERGMPATGERYEIPGVSIGRLRDGRIVENRDYWDLAGYLTQIGLMPAPEGVGGPAT